jgi:hypothetical protein
MFEHSFTTEEFDELCFEFGTRSVCLISNLLTPLKASNWTRMYEQAVRIRDVAD